MSTTSLFDVRIAMRHIAKDLGYAIVVLSGLAMSLSAILLLIAYVDATLQADEDIPDASRIARLEATYGTPGVPAGWNRNTPFAFQQHWAQSGMPVERATRVYTASLPVKAGSLLTQEEIAFVDADFAEVFRIPALSGDLRQALDAPDGVVLSTRAAQKFFGTELAVGRTLTLDGKPHSVKAVVRNRALGSAINTTMFANIKSAAMPEPRRLDTWLDLPGQNFIKKFPNASDDDIAAKARAYFEGTSEYKALPASFRQGSRPLFEARVIPLSRLAIDGADGGRRKVFLWGLAISGLLLSLLAIINFTNLTTVKTLARQREIAIRKTIGATPFQITSQFFLEALFISVAAIALALPLSFGIAVLMDGWLNVSLSEMLFTPYKLAAIFAIAVGLGVFCGLSPAMLAHAIHPARALSGRGRVESTWATISRRALVSLQMGIAVFMIGISLIIFVQLDHAARADLGFDASTTLAIDLPVGTRDPRSQAFRDAVSAVQNVSAVGLSRFIPGNSGSIASARVRNPQGQEFTVAYENVGAGYFEAFGVRPLAGRVFERGRDVQGNTDIAVVDEKAAKLLGFSSAAEAVGKRVPYESSTVEIIGVVPDMRLRGLRENPQPTMFAIRQFNLRAVSIRTSNPIAAIREVETVWNRLFPDNVIKIQTVTQILSEQYRSDRGLGGMLAVGMVMAIFLAGCGTYALAAVSLQRRILEIVLRKLHGASAWQIARLFAAEFAGLFAMGALIALPLLALVGGRYVSAFTTQIALFWPIVLALVIAGAVTTIAVSRHAYRAMALRPAVALSL